MTRLILPILVAAACAAGCGDAAKSGAPAPAPTPSAAPAPEAGKSAAAKPYPLTTCIVSGEELGGMGPPVVRVYDGVEVKFCCEQCIGEFEKDKAKYLAKLNAK